MMLQDKGPISEDLKLVYKYFLAILVFTCLITNLGEFLLQ